jgi:hypothetical protein
MKTVLLSLLLMVLISRLAACKGAPGANGEYATHGRGYNNRGP